MYVWQFTHYTIYVIFHVYIQMVIIKSKCIYMGIYWFSSQLECAVVIRSEPLQSRHPHSVGRHQVGPSRWWWDSAEAEKNADIPHHLWRRTETAKGDWSSKLCGVLCSHTKGSQNSVWWGSPSCFEASYYTEEEKEMFLTLSAFVTNNVYMYV